MSTPIATTFADHVTVLKRRIRGDLTDIVRDFEAQTGMTPSAIEVEMVERSHSDNTRIYGVGVVTVRFNV